MNTTSNITVDFFDEASKAIDIEEKVTKNMKTYFY